MALADPFILSLPLPQVVVERCPGKRRQLMWDLILHARDRAVADANETNEEEGNALVATDSWHGGGFVEDEDAAYSSDEDTDDLPPVRRGTARF